ncbi:MAG: type II toxin-antitoxin system RelE/ParE family toxin [Patescibacteria group bacterium]|nr:type II toxin-antitoxin system RelE/ParE family toxin [Patescibacteria group bacterium]
MISKFEIVYTKSAVKDIERMDKVVKRKLKLKLELFLKNPLKNAKKLINPIIGSYRWWIGNHRVIFDVGGNKIVVLKIGHRKDIYK